MSEDVRRLEVALARQGLDPRRYAAEILRADPARFWLLARAGELDAPGFFREAEKRTHHSVPATGVFGNTPHERWEALHAFPVVTIEESVALARVCAARGHATTLWDRKSAVRASGDGAPYLRVEEGWREPRDGPNSRFGIARGNVFTPAERTHVRYGDATFAVPALPEITTAVIVEGRRETTLTLLIPLSLHAHALALALATENQRVEVDVDGRAVFRAGPPRHAPTSNLTVLPSGDARWSVTVAWLDADPLAPNTVSPEHAAVIQSLAGPRCSFCETPIRSDGFSCGCPPCVLCRGPHPARRCPIRPVPEPVMPRTSEDPAASRSPAPSTPPPARP